MTFSGHIHPKRLFFIGLGSISLISNPNKIEPYYDIWIEKSPSRSYTISYPSVTSFSVGNPNGGFTLKWGGADFHKDDGVQTEVWGSISGCVWIVKSHLSSLYLIQD